MKQTYPISDFDVIYISYDEPNAEKNWADLLSKCPWAKRVHGVKGFDAAHNKAGEISETHRLVTVDGDNTVRQDTTVQSFLAYVYRTGITLRAYQPQVTSTR